MTLRQRDFLFDAAFAIIAGVLLGGLAAAGF